MKIFSMMVLLSLAVLGLAGCPGSATNTTVSTTNSRTNTVASNGNMVNSNQAVVVNSNSNMTGSNGNMTNSTSGTTAPNGFINEAAKGGMAEIELSKTALNRVQNKEVRDFAQKMVIDHTKASYELGKLAEKKNVALPTEMDAEHKSIKDAMLQLTGAEYDKKYVDTMVADHEKTVNLFKTQAESGTDAEAKAFAAQTLPTLQMHLDMIKKIQGKMK